MISAESLNIILHEETETNILSTTNNYINKIRGFLKLDNVNSTINSINYCTVKYRSSVIDYIQFSVNFTLPLNFKIDLKIDYPKDVLQLNNDLNMCNRLRIFINDENVRQELISFTNYLQRQKNVCLAVCILKKFALLVSERRSILDMLILHTNSTISLTFDEVNGYEIKCKDAKFKFKFFESSWKINFNCIDHNVKDFVDFSVTTLDMNFNGSVKPVMQCLTKPSLKFNEKFSYWWTIIQAVNIFTQMGISTPIQLEFQDFVRVQGSQEIEDLLEIIESDEEDCIIVDG